MIFKDKKYISASLMCANMLRLEEEIKMLEEAQIDFFHIDIMDGKFVPNYAIGIDTATQIRSITDIPFDYHLMVTNPLETIKMLHLKENDMVSVHIESGCDFRKAFNYVKNRKSKFGIAINPGTEISSLKEYAAKIDFVLVMLVNPGFSGQPMARGALEKVEKVREILRKSENNESFIAVDGHVGTETIRSTQKNGANFFVAGTTCLFGKETPYMNIVDEIKSI